MNKRLARLRRAKKSRAKISQLGVNRLSVFRSSKNIYAQIINPRTGHVLAAASSLDPEFGEEIKKASGDVAGKILKSMVVGKLVARRALANGVKTVAFDRSGYLYHGRVKALAEAARQEGMEF